MSDQEVKAKKEKKPQVAKARYYVDNSARNTKRQATRQQARRNKLAEKLNAGKPVVHGKARAARRAAGDFDPVNKAASLEQAPEGRFARSVVKAEQALHLQAKKKSKAGYAAEPQTLGEILRTAVAQ
jgi:hypothetical protein